MAQRRIGTLPLQENVETEKQMPLDARQLVRSKEEMLTEGSFTYGYKGLFTAERTEGKLWMLIDNANPTQESSWKVIGPYDDSALDARVTALEQGGGGESGLVDWSDVQNKPSFASVATSGSYNDLIDRPVLPAPYDDSALSGRVSALENAGFLTEHQDISGKANTADLATVATSGSYNDLSDQPTIPEAYDDTGLRNRVTALENKTETQADWNESDSTSAAYIANKPAIPPAVTVDAAMSDTSENPVQNKVVLAAIGDAIDVVEAAIADRYTKAETDGKIAEAMVDVDNEHFHPVTVLPDPSVARENHEYVLITYAQDGTTIESETHYLFYDGMFHQKQTQVSLDGYATEAYVGQQLATLATVASSGSYNDLADVPQITAPDGTFRIEKIIQENNTAHKYVTSGDGYRIKIDHYLGDGQYPISYGTYTSENISLRKLSDDDTMEFVEFTPNKIGLHVEEEVIFVVTRTPSAKSNNKYVHLNDEIKAGFISELGLDLTALTDEEIAALVPA